MKWSWAGARVYQYLPIQFIFLLKCWSLLYLPHLVAYRSMLNLLARINTGYVLSYFVVSLFWWIMIFSVFQSTYHPKIQGVICNLIILNSVCMFCNGFWSFGPILMTFDISAPLKGNFLVQLALWSPHRSHVSEWVVWIISNVMLVVVVVQKNMLCLLHVTDT